MTIAWSMYAFFYPEQWFGWDINPAGSKSRSLIISSSIPPAALILVLVHSYSTLCFVSSLECTVYLLVVHVSVWPAWVPSSVSCPSSYNTSDPPLTHHHQPAEPRSVLARLHGPITGRHSCLGRGWCPLIDHAAQLYSLVPSHERVWERARLVSRIVKLFFPLIGALRYIRSPWQCKTAKWLTGEISIMCGIAASCTGGKTVVGCSCKVKWGISE